MPRIASLHAAGSRAAETMAEQIRALDRPVHSLFWIANSKRPQDIASALERVAPCSVGGSTLSGLIGGGAEYFATQQEDRLVAAAITLPDDAHATAFHSSADGLPDFSEDEWEQFASATPRESPNLMLLASPPRNASFPLESWLSRLDSMLPWACKVGGLVGGGDGRLYVGGAEHNGGAVGVALSGRVQMDALVCQGATPVGPSYRITHMEAGSLVRELDGLDVSTALRPALEEWEAAGGEGSLMAGISVDPTARAARRPDEEHDGGGGRGGGERGGGGSGLSRHEASYVVRQITGYFPKESAIAIGASADLLEAPGGEVRLQLHAYSARNARTELSARAAALRAAAPETVSHHGGLIVSCAGRGEALYGEAGVETAALREELGAETALAGWFANGEIGPVGRRSVVHTFTTTVALLRSREAEQA